jgi:hypothetical protein
MADETPKPLQPIVTSTNLRTGRTLATVHDPAYWQALGEFIEAFSSAELGLMHYLIWCAKLRHDVGRALLSGIHVDQMINFIRRVWQIIPPDADIAEKLSGVLEQFKLISDVRNSMVHYVSLVSSDKGRISSNATRALTDRHIREHRVEPKILQEMTADVRKISNHLSYAEIATVDPRRDRSELAKSFPALVVSWRYKPLEDQPPISPRRRRRDRR